MTFLSRFSAHIPRRLPVETEVKLALTPHQAERLRGRLGTPTETGTHENLYLQNLFFVGWGWTARLRREGSDVHLTLKGPKLKLDNGFRKRPELECKVDPRLWDQAMAGRVDLSAEVRKLFESRGRRVPLGLAASGVLEPVGSPPRMTTTTRSVFELPGAKPGAHLELDLTRFPNGVSSFEAEAESGRSGRQQRKTLKAVSRVFQEAGVPMVIGKQGKRKRALGG